MNQAAGGVPAVELRDVRKGFVRDWLGRRRPALDGVSLRIGRGVVVAVAGPNGSGKTTLLRLCAGLIRPDAGLARVLGRRPEEARADGRVAFVGDGEILPPHLPAHFCLGAVAAVAGSPPAAIGTALDRVGMSAEAATPAGALSRGRRQRLALATTALGSPDLVLLDEPGAGVDPHAARHLGALLRAHRSEGRTVLFTTHFLPGAEEDADRFVVLSAGRVAWSGDRAEVAARGGLTEVYRAEVPE